MQDPLVIYNSKLNNIITKDLTLDDENFLFGLLGYGVINRGRGETSTVTFDVINSLLEKSLDSFKLAKFLNNFSKMFTGKVVPISVNGQKHEQIELFSKIQVNPLKEVLFITNTNSDTYEYLATKDYNPSKVSPNPNYFNMDIVRFKLNEFKRIKDKNTRVIYRFCKEVSLDLIHKITLHKALLEDLLISKRMVDTRAYWQKHIVEPTLHLRHGNYRLDDLTTSPEDVELSMDNELNDTNSVIINGYPVTQLVILNVCRKPTFEEVNNNLKKYI